VSHHWLIPLAAIAAQLLFIGGLARRAFIDTTTRLAVLLLLMVVGWNVGYFGLFYFPDPVRAELWSRVSRTWVCFGPPLLLHSILVVMGYGGRLWTVLLVAGYVAASLLAVASALGMLASGVSPHPYGWLPDPTPLYGAFTLLVVVYLVLSAGLTAYRYVRPLTPLQRAQGRFHALAIVVLLPFLLTNLLAIHHFPILPLGSVGTVLWSWTLAYAITRHRIVDIDYVVRKALSFLMAALPIVVPGGIGMAYLSEMMGAENPVILAAASIALSLVAGFVIPTAQEALETRVERVLFPERYNVRRRLQELSDDLVHVLDRATLLWRLGDGLSDILEPKVCEVAILDDKARRLTLAYPAATDADPVPEEMLAWLKTLTEPVLTAELEAARSPGAALFRSRGWEVGLPLRIGQHLIGVVGLGANRDLRMYSVEDIWFLGRVAVGASVALENANLSRLLRQSEVVLERANQLSSVGQLAAGIAHEIRNPLVAVKTFLDLLPEKIGDREFVQNFRELSLSELKRVTTLITDLLALGKSPKAKRSMVALAPTLEPVLRLMESTAQKRGVELTSHLAPRLPEVWADPDQLKQVVLNLLLNAIEASPSEGHVHLSVNARRPVLGDTLTVAIDVYDEGPGIPKERLEDIFHPFFTTKETGTGLGLALVHQMVVEHGGEITVESELGHGTVFHVVFPVVRRDQAVESPELVQASQASPAA
jgi:signal transduction histidine kinase